MVKFAVNRGKQVLVVEISRASLKIGYFLRSLSRLELVEYSLEKLDPQQKDAAGQITGLLRGFLEEKSISLKEAILSISDADSIAIKYCVLPALSRKEIFSAAKWELKEEVPFDLEDAYSDWRVVKEFTDEDGARHQGIIFVFIRKEAVEKYLSCLQHCGLRASAIVTNAVNYIDILKGMSENKQFTCEMVLDLEYFDSALNLYLDKKLHFARYLPVSVDSYTRSLIATFASGAGKDNLELTLNEAEEIRDNIGIPQDETGLIRDNLHANQIISLIRPVLENMVREIKHSITYFTSSLGQPTPQIIYLTGLGANIKNLDAHLGKELGFPVARLPLPAILDAGRIPPDRLAKDSSQIVSCAGAALSTGAGIRLVSGGLRLGKFQRSWKKYLISFISAAGILILSLMLISVCMLPVYNYRLKKARDYFKGKKLLSTFFERVRPQKELLLQVPLQRIPAVALLNFISQSITDKICLDEFDLDQPRGELILQGEATQLADIDGFVQRLQASGFFSAIKMQLLGKNPNGQGFKIKCDLIY
jgi:type IV pilus assembly protein PilM